MSCTVSDKINTRIKDLKQHTPSSFLQHCGEDFQALLFPGLWISRRGYVVLYIIRISTEITAP